MTPRATSDPCDPIFTRIVSVRAEVAALDVPSYEGASLEGLRELSKALRQLLLEARNLASRLTRVVFPEPLSPMRPTHSPGSIRRFTC